MSDEWLRAPRQLRLAFLAATLLLSATLVWLGWRLLGQDQQLLDQRLAEQREIAADVAVAALDRRLSAVEQELSRVAAAGEGAKNAPAGEAALLVQFLPDAIHTWPKNSLICYPELPQAPETPAGIFAVADGLEFQKRDYSGAIAALRQQADSADLRIQAAALVRVARNYLKDGQFQESLKAYERLAALGSVPVGGMPAALAGRLGALAVYEQQKERAGLLRTAQALHHDLSSRQWPLTCATYHYLADQGSRWLPEQDRTPAPRVDLAEGVEWLWETWRENRDDPTPAGGRTSLFTPSGSVLLMWWRSQSSMAAFVAGADYLQSQWLSEVKPRFDSHGVSLALMGLDGRYVLGSAPAPGSHAAVRLPSATQLPWTVQVTSAGNGADLAAFRFRRTLLVGGMCVLLALILISGWFIFHSVARELAIARLQSDFVSAVSHEFRTPLTMLCQLSELLMRGRVASEGDRQQYYELLHRESGRLRQLVERILDFGRLEARKMHFRPKKLDAAALVRQVVEEFQQEQVARGHRFEVAADSGPGVVQADREALRCVVWNLLENAVKYSPDCNTVWVEMNENGKRVMIAVRDHGVGIPRSEQQRIFERFVRGAAAVEHKIRGTGLGLAMARQIVRAHGGEITLESEPGKGSTFRVLLPRAE